MNMSTKTIKISIDDLIDKFKKYNDNEEDIALIRRAYDYAEKKHFGQKRISGDDYILHPLNVALILTEISADAAWLLRFFMILLKTLMLLKKK